MDHGGSTKFIAGITGPLRSVGFIPALTGSVLTYGASKNDLDIVIYPEIRGVGRVDDAKRILEDSGLDLMCDRAKVTGKWRKNGSADTKWVEVWMTKSKKKVDIFFLDCDQFIPHAEDKTPGSP